MHYWQLKTQFFTYLHFTLNNCFGQQNQEIVDQHLHKNKSRHYSTLSFQTLFQSKVCGLNILKQEAFKRMTPLYYKIKHRMQIHSSIGQQHTHNQCVYVQSSFLVIIRFFSVFWLCVCAGKHHILDYCFRNLD